MFRSKRYKSLEGERNVDAGLEEALEKVKGGAGAKFDETVDMSFNLNLLKKHTIRDTIVYPNGFGAQAKVLVFAKGEKAEAAKEAGADYVGAEDMVEKILGGWLDFDATVATPDMMRVIAKAARILGTKGLMPNPKAKTVTDDPAAAVKEIKGGRREFRANKEGIINFPVGKASMEVSQLSENVQSLYSAVMKKKPNDLKGDYIKSVFVSSTMGRSFRLNRKSL